MVQWLAALDFTIVMPHTHTHIHTTLHTMVQNIITTPLNSLLHFLQPIKGEWVLFVYFLEKKYLAEKYFRKY